MQFSLWRRGIAVAVVLWLVAFLVATLLGVLGGGSRSLPGAIVLLLVILAVTWVLGSRLTFVSLTQGVAVGVLLVCVNVLMDYLIVGVGLSRGDPSFLVSWIVWVRYALLLLVPVILASRRQTTA